MRSLLTESTLTQSPRNTGDPETTQRPRNTSYRLTNLPIDSVYNPMYHMCVFP